MLPGKTYTPADILQMVRRRLVLIIVPLIVGLYLALVASTMRHEQYTSETLIQVIPQRVPDNFVQSTVTMRTEDRLNALQQETMSRKKVEGIIREMGLYPEELKETPMQDVVDLMRRNAKIEAVVKVIGSLREAESFYLRFTYGDAETAQRVTDRLATLFIELNTRDREQSSQNVGEFLQGQLADKRRKLEETDAKLERFRKENAGRLPDQVEFNMQMINTTNSTILGLTEVIQHDRNEKLMLEGRVRDAESEIAVAGRTVASRPAQDKLKAAQVELANLRLRMKPDHLEVLKKEKAIAQLEKLAAEEAASAPAPGAPETETAQQTLRRQRLQEDKAKIKTLESQIEFNEQQEKNHRAKLTEYQRHLAEVPGVTTEFSALTRDYLAQKEDYEGLLKKSSNADVAVELERNKIGEQFKVLDPASLPIRPTGIPRVAVNGVGAVVGLVLGVLLAAFLELRDTTFSTGDDIVTVLQLPVVALIPYVISDADRRRARRQKQLTAAAAVVLCIAGGYGIWALELWKHVV